MTALFGIDLQQSANNIVRRNRITSGRWIWVSRDAIAVNSFNNGIRGKRRHLIHGISSSGYSRDSVATTATARTGGPSLHFVTHRYQPGRENDFPRARSVYLPDILATAVSHRYAGTISHAAGSPRRCRDRFEDGGVDIVDNEILYCATGLHLDVSPFQPDHQPYPRQPGRLQRRRHPVSTTGPVMYSKTTLSRAT